MFTSTGKSGNFSKTNEKEENKIKETPPSSKQPPVATMKKDMKPKSEYDGFFQKPKGSYEFQNCRSAYKYRKAHQKAATKSSSDSTDAPAANAAAASAALKEAMEQAEAKMRSAKEMRESIGKLFKSSAKLDPNDAICSEERENKAECEGKSFSKKLIHAAAMKKPEFRESPPLTNEGINPFQSSYNSVETSGTREGSEEISQLVNDANDAEEVFKCSEKEGNMKEVKAKSKNRAEEGEETESNDRRSQEMMIGFKEKSELKTFSKYSQVITGCNGETEKSEKTEKITNAVVNTSRKEETDKIIDEVKEVCISEKDKISLEPSPQVVDPGQYKSKKEDYVNFSIIQEKTESKSGASKVVFKLDTSSIQSAAVESVKMKEVKTPGVKIKNNEEDSRAQELFLGETNEKSKAVEKTLHREENENIRKPANLSYYTEKTPYEIKETDQKLEPEEPKKFERTQYAHNKGIIGGKEIPQLQSFTKKSQLTGELASKYKRDGNTYSYNETFEWYSDAKKYTNTLMGSRSEEEMKGLFDTFPKVSMQVKDKISKELAPEVDVHGQDKNNIEDLTTQVKTELEPDSRMNSNETCKDSEETYKPGDFYYARKEEKKSLASKKDHECARCVEELNAIPGLPVLDVSMKTKVLIYSKEEDTNNEENRASKESFLYEAEKKTVAARGTSHCGEKEKIKAPSNFLYSAEKDRCKVKEIDQKGELKEPKKAESIQYAHSQDKSEKEIRPETAKETIEDAANKNKLGSAKEGSQIDYAEKWAAVTQLLRQCSEKNHKTTFEKEKTMDRMRKDEENGRKDVQREDASGKGGVEEKNVHKEKLLQRKLEEKEREIERQKDNLAVKRVLYGAHERAVAKDRHRATKVAADKAEARERAAKASSEKASEGAKVRAAVARATAEALERAARKAALEARQCTERSMSSSGNNRAKDNEAQGHFQANYMDINQRSTKPDVSREIRNTIWFSPFSL